jgi:glutamate dehydrogenase
VVCKDDDDAYLVVAADKGTASFSDIANEISRQYGFWLGDAFASGGSVGYDHKKMGITARGAWVSVERHCRELGLRIDQAGISAIGIGDMSGDVFGNGMLRSPNIRLLAAFNHLHIFVDPEPDAAAGYRERERLFRLPRSGWEDYEPALISSGGGVFRRSAKSIPISPQLRERFAIDAEQLTPAELISALLRAPVDLIWNGGIGTSDKSSRESHADCGDTPNAPLRVDAAELRCRIIAEGGNLGVTQLGRVEYALRGGRCNTDFIDNAGGVDCSDHEVNIKIALNALVAAGDMTEKQRRELLESMTEAIAELVLRNNYRQTQALSLAEREALVRTGEYRRLIQRMELDGRLSRALEFIPDDDTLVERKAAGKALTRPELAVLISYTKSQLKTELVATDAPDDPHLARALDSAFPAVLREHYGSAIDGHRLRREIIATQLANDMVNLMGITFVDRITFSTGAAVGDVVRGYVTARDVFDMHVHWQQIEALDGSIDADLQLEMMAALMRLVRRGARWFIRNRRTGLDPARELERFRAPLAELYRHLPGLIEGGVAQDYEQRRQQLVEAGVPATLAAYVAAANLLYSCLGIIDAADGLGAPVVKVGEVYMALAQQLELDWFAKQIADLKIENQWQALAREAYRDDLEWQMRALAVGALRHLCGDGDVDTCIRDWIAQQEPLVGRWRAMLTELHGTDAKEFAMYSVAIRELLDLAQSSRMESAA